MTTPRDEATALLAEALDAAPWEPVTDPMDLVTYEDAARSLLAASPTLAADLSFAIAWRRVVRALPEVGHITLGWHHGESYDTGTAVWFALAHVAGCADEVQANGPTPTAALTRLAEALEGVSK